MELLPNPLIFVGGGYISFEFAHIAARAEVTILHQDDRSLAHFDRDLVNRLRDKSRRAGIDIRLHSRSGNRNARAIWWSSMTVQNGESDPQISH
jgi:pyruvate/2-oxoglutarate dehydrogenase complex dihydrolipoamide dehydrogenase (E3) component